MSPVHLHLALNHFPIVGLLVISLLFTWATLRKNAAVARASRVLIILLGLSSLPVYFSGEPTEHAIEHSVSIQEAAIEAHEESAEFSLALTLLSVAVAAISFIPHSTLQRIEGPLQLGLVVCTLAASASLINTGYLGGQIRHTELQSGQAAQSSESGSKAKEHADNEKSSKDSTASANQKSASDKDEDDD